MDCLWYVCLIFMHQVSFGIIVYELCFPMNQTQKRGHCLPQQPSINEIFTMIGGIKLKKKNEILIDSEKMKRRKKIVKSKNASVV